MDAHLSVKKLTLSLHDQTVEVRLPQSMAADIECLFPTSMITSAAAQSCVTIQEHKDGYTVYSGSEPSEIAVPRSEVPLRLMEEVTKALVTRLDTAIALHAAAVGYNGASVLMPGKTGSGKSSLAAWLLDNGFDYLTDEVAILTDDHAVLGLPRPLVIKPGAAESVSTFSAFKQSGLVECGSHLLGVPAGAKINSGAHPVGLIIFPRYEAGADVKIETLAAGVAGLKLIACNLNARNLKKGGFETIAALSRRTPAVAFRYGGFDQLKGTLDAIIRLALDNHFTAAEMRRFLACTADIKRSAPASARSPAAERGSRSRVRHTVRWLRERLATWRDTKANGARSQPARSMKLIGYVIGEHWPDIRPAPLERTWMECTRQRFAYRCLPLNIANGHGWEILCPSGFSAIWDGGAGLDAVSIQPDVGTTAPALSHFGHGVLTFTVPCLFRTDPGVDLMVQGPVNRPKDAIGALTGGVETDWAPYTFTMNWLFTRPGVRVRFEKGEPYCHIFPVRRGELDAIAPVLRPLSDDPALNEQYETWSTSRLRFNADLKQAGSMAQAEKWQKFYYYGLDADKLPMTVTGHRTRLRLRPFTKG